MAKDTNNTRTAPAEKKLMQMACSKEVGKRVAALAKATGYSQGYWLEHCINFAFDNSPVISKNKAAVEQITKMQAELAGSLGERKTPGRKAA